MWGVCLLIIRTIWRVLVAIGRFVVNVSIAVAQALIDGFRTYFLSLQSLLFAGFFLFIYLLGLIAIYKTEFVMQTVDKAYECAAYPIADATATYALRPARDYLVQPLWYVNYVVEDVKDHFGDMVDEDKAIVDSNATGRDKSADIFDNAWDFLLYDMVDSLWHASPPLFGPNKVEVPFTRMLIMDIVLWFADVGAPIWPLNRDTFSAAKNLTMGVWRGDLLPKSCYFQDLRSANEDCWAFRGCTLFDHNDTCAHDANGYRIAGSCDCHDIGCEFVKSLWTKPVITIIDIVTNITLEMEIVVRNNTRVDVCALLGNASFYDVNGTCATFDYDCDALSWYVRPSHLSELHCGECDKDVFPRVFAEAPYVGGSCLLADACRSGPTPGECAYVDGKLLFRDMDCADVDAATAASIGALECDQTCEERRTWAYWLHRVLNDYVAEEMRKITIAVQDSACCVVDYAKSWFGMLVLLFDKNCMARGLEKWQYIAYYQLFSWVECIKPLTDYIFMWKFWPLQELLWQTWDLLKDVYVSIWDGTILTRSTFFCNELAPVPRKCQTLAKAAGLGCDVVTDVVNGTLMNVTRFRGMSCAGLGWDDVCADAYCPPEPNGTCDVLDQAWCNTTVPSQSWIPPTANVAGVVLCDALEDPCFIRTAMGGPCHMYEGCKPFDPTPGNETDTCSPGRRCEGDLQDFTGRFWGILNGTIVNLTYNFLGNDSGATRQIVGISAVVFDKLDCLTDGVKALFGTLILFADRHCDAPTATKLDYLIDRVVGDTIGCFAGFARLLHQWGLHKLAVLWERLFDDVLGDLLYHFWSGDILRSDTYFCSLHAEIRILDSKPPQTIWRDASGRPRWMFEGCELFSGGECEISYLQCNATNSTEGCPCTNCNDPLSEAVDIAFDFVNLTVTSVADVIDVQVISAFLDSIVDILWTIVEVARRLFLDWPRNFLGFFFMIFLGGCEAGGKEIGMFMAQYIIFWPFIVILNGLIDIFASLGDFWKIIADFIWEFLKSTKMFSFLTEAIDDARTMAYCFSGPLPLETEEDRLKFNYTWIPYSVSWGFDIPKCVKLWPSKSYGMLQKSCDLSGCMTLAWQCVRYQNITDRYEENWTLRQYGWLGRIVAGKGFERTVTGLLNFVDGITCPFVCMKECKTCGKVMRKIKCFFKCFGRPEYRCNANEDDWQESLDDQLYEMGCIADCTCPSVNEDYGCYELCYTSHARHSSPPWGPIPCLTTTEASRLCHNYSLITAMHTRLGNYVDAYRPQPFPYNETSAAKICTQYAPIYTDDSPFYMLPADHPYSLKWQRAVKFCSSWCPQTAYCNDTGYKAVMTAIHGCEAVYMIMRTPENVSALAEYWGDSYQDNNPFNLTRPPFSVFGKDATNESFCAFHQARPGEYDDDGSSILEFSPWFYALSRSWLNTILDTTDCGVLDCTCHHLIKRLMVNFIYHSIVGRGYTFGSGFVYNYDPQRDWSLRYPDNYWLVMMDSTDPTEADAYHNGTFGGYWEDDNRPYVCELPVLFGAYAATSCRAYMFSGTEEGLLSYLDQCVNDPCYCGTATCDPSVQCAQPCYEPCFYACQGPCMNVSNAGAECVEACYDACVPPCVVDWTARIDACNAAGNATVCTCNYTYVCPNNVTANVTGAVCTGNATLDCPTNCTCIDYSVGECIEVSTPCNATWLPMCNATRETWFCNVTTTCDVLTSSGNSTGPCDGSSFPMCPPGCWCAYFEACPSNGTENCTCPYEYACYDYGVVTTNSLPECPTTPNCTAGCTCDYAFVGVNETVVGPCSPAEICADYCTTNCSGAVNDTVCFHDYVVECQANCSTDCSAYCADQMNVTGTCRQECDIVCADWCALCHDRCVPECEALVNQNCSANCTAPPPLPANCTDYASCPELCNCTEGYCLFYCAPDYVFNCTPCTDCDAYCDVDCLSCGIEECVDPCLIECMTVPVVDTCLESCTADPCADQCAQEAIDRCDILDIECIREVEDRCLHNCIAECKRRCTGTETLSDCKEDCRIGCDETCMVQCNAYCQGNINPFCVSMCLDDCDENCTDACYAVCIAEHNMTAKCIAACPDACDSCSLCNATFVACAAECATNATLNCTVPCPPYGNETWTNCTGPCVNVTECLAGCTTELGDCELSCAGSDAACMANCTEYCVNTTTNLYATCQKACQADCHSHYDDIAIICATDQVCVDEYLTMCYSPCDTECGVLYDPDACENRCLWDNAISCLNTCLALYGVGPHFRPCFDTCNAAEQCTEVCATCAENCTVSCSVPTHQIIAAMCESHDTLCIGLAMDLYYDGMCTPACVAEVCTGDTDVAACMVKCQWNDCALPCDATCGSTCGANKTCQHLCMDACVGSCNATCYENCTANATALCIDACPAACNATCPDCDALCSPPCANLTLNCALQCTGNCTGNFTGNYTGPWALYPTNDTCACEEVCIDACADCLGACAACTVDCVANCTAACLDPPPPILLVYVGRDEPRAMPTESPATRSVVAATALREGRASLASARPDFSAARAAAAEAITAASMGRGRYAREEPGGGDRSTRPDEPGEGACRCDRLAWEHGLKGRLDMFRDRVVYAICLAARAAWGQLANPGVRERALMCDGFGDLTDLAALLQTAASMETLTSETDDATAFQVYLAEHLEAIAEDRKGRSLGDRIKGAIFGFFESVGEAYSDSLLQRAVDRALAVRETNPSYTDDDVGNWMQATWDDFLLWYRGTPTVTMGYGGRPLRNPAALGAMFERPKEAVSRPSLSERREAAESFYDRVFEAIQESGGRLGEVVTKYAATARWSEGHGERSYIFFPGFEEIIGSPTAYLQKLVDVSARQYAGRPASADPMGISILNITINTTGSMNFDWIVDKTAGLFEGPFNRLIDYTQTHDFKDFADSLWQTLKDILRCHSTAQYDGTEVYNIFCIAFPQAITDWVPDETIEPEQIDWGDEITLTDTCDIVDYGDLNRSRCYWKMHLNNCDLYPNSTMFPMCPHCDYCEREYDPKAVRMDTIDCLLFTATIAQRVLGRVISPHFSSGYNATWVDKVHFTINCAVIFFASTALFTYIYGYSIARIIATILLGVYMAINGFFVHWVVAIVVFFAYGVLGLAAWVVAFLVLVFVEITWCPDISGWIASFLEWLAGTMPFSWIPGLRGASDRMNRLDFGCTAPIPRTYISLYALYISKTALVFLIGQAVLLLLLIPLINILRAFFNLLFDLIAAITLIILPIRVRRLRKRVRLHEERIDELRQEVDHVHEELHISKQTPAKKKR